MSPFEMVTVSDTLKAQDSNFIQIHKSIPFVPEKQGQDQRTPGEHILRGEYEDVPISQHEEAILKSAFRLIQASVDVMSSNDWLSLARAAMELAMWARTPTSYNCPTSHMTSS
uniref:Uncharacterized protein LOC111137471 n=1 Tax=Crassostrea virginica TaxID=6565 RepID=A0A8B8EXH5_CRAVI|nr:uncharacterized protein LOC111137471 [Crassostrea virginica]